MSLHDPDQNQDPTSESGPIAIVFMGGGVKGFAYIGVARVFRHINLLQKIATYGGSSAGAITALFLALGLTPEEAEQRLSEPDKMLDHGRVRSFTRLVFAWPMHSGEQLMRLLRDAIAMRVRRHNREPNLADLEQETGTRLILTTTAKQRGKAARLWVYDSRNSLDQTIQKDQIRLRPNTVSAHFATYVSAAHPLLFEGRFSEDHFLSDGGIRRNFPVDVVEALGLPLEKIIGVYIRTSDPEPTGWWGRIQERLETFLPGGAIDEDCAARLRDLGNLVEIDLRNVSTTRMRLTTEERQELIRAGEVAAARWLRTRREAENGGALPALLPAWGPTDAAYLERMVDSQSPPVVQAGPGLIAGSWSTLVQVTLLLANLNRILKGIPSLSALLTSFIAVAGILRLGVPTILEDGHHYAVVSPDGCYYPAAPEGSVAGDLIRIIPDCSSTGTAVEECSVSFGRVDMLKEQLITRPVKSQERVCSRARLERIQLNCNPDGTSVLSVSREYHTYPLPDSSIKFSTVTIVTQGEPTIGCPVEHASECNDEAIPRRANIPARYEIATTEVTRALWLEVMQTDPLDQFRTNSANRNGRKCRLAETDGFRAPIDEPEWPVGCVTWNESVQFCNKLSERLRLQPAYEQDSTTGEWLSVPDRNGFRLPTEHEWEYAAIGASFPHYSFAGSDERERVAWTSENSGKVAHPVCEKEPNSLGLFDMSGNQWEWTSTKQDKYRVGRGGAWRFGAEWAHPWTRWAEGEDHDRFLGMGLRIARTPDTAK